MFEWLRKRRAAPTACAAIPSVPPGGAKEIRSPTPDRSGDVVDLVGGAAIGVGWAVSLSSADAAPAADAPSTDAPDDAACASASDGDGSCGGGDGGGGDGGD